MCVDYSILSPNILFYLRTNIYVEILYSKIYLMRNKIIL